MLRKLSSLPSAHSLRDWAFVPVVGRRLSGFRSVLLQYLSFIESGIRNLCRLCGSAFTESSAMFMDPSLGSRLECERRHQIAEVCVRLLVRPAFCGKTSIQGQCPSFYKFVSQRTGLGTAWKEQGITFWFSECTHSGYIYHKYNHMKLTSLSQSLVN